jgi:hypothetical protein
MKGVMEIIKQVNLKVRMTQQHQSNLREARRRRRELSPEKVLLSTRKVMMLLLKR